MKATLKLHLLVLLALLILPGSARAQSTAFTYNGRLSLSGALVSGAYEMRFTLFDGITGGNILGSPLTILPVNVTNGLFTTRLDFGAGIFSCPARWLEVAVNPANGGALTPLTPRQEVTSSPYAIRAQTAGSVANGTVVANQLNTGGVGPAPGQFLSYDGNNLYWSDPGIATGNIWSRNGADTYFNVGNVGIGTSTPTPGIRLEVNGAARLTPGNGSINFGSPNAELGMSIIPTLGGGNSRADLRFDGAVLKLVASTGVAPHLPPMGSPSPPTAASPSAPARPRRDINWKWMEPPSSDPETGRFSSELPTGKWGCP